MTGKTKFSDEQVARDEAERLREKEGIDLQTYRCGHCDEWHFTSQES